MSKSVPRDGTVCGPAPLQNASRVIRLSDRQPVHVDVGSTATVPEGPEKRLPSDHSLAVARAALQNARKSAQHFEARLEKVCSGLLVAGEQIPSIDQQELSMLQEAYINASTAYRVANEKAMIWQGRVDRLLAPARAAGNDDEWSMAA
ncbi:MAG: hypothetical protein AAF404_19805 [Pseudomonadota bacterium]